MTSNNTPKLRLWYSPATCSLAPHVMLLEAGVPFDTFAVDITKGGFPDEYRKINPKGRVPILEWNDEVITETVAIMTAASRLAPQKQLFGSSDLDVIRTYEWLNWLSGTVHERGLGGTFLPANYSDDTSAHDGIRTKSREWVDTCWAMIDQRLQKQAEERGLTGRHAVGEVFTAADVFLWVIYRWGYLFDVDMRTKYPHWTKLVDQVVKRDSVKEAVRREDIPIIEDNRLKKAQAMAKSQASDS